jgi:hypothetical protein
VTGGKGRYAGPRGGAFERFHDRTGPVPTPSALRDTSGALDFVVNIKTDTARGCNALPITVTAAASARRSTTT